MESNLRCEVFHTGTSPAGVLLRRRADSGLDTLVLIDPPEGERSHNESRVWFAGDVFDWTRYTFAEGDHRVEAAREEIADERRVIPGYAEYLLLADVGALRGLPVQYLRLRDGAPQEPAVTATVRPVGHEDVQLPGGRELRCARIDVVEGEDEVVSRHWFHGTTMVASDWRGLDSSLVPDLETALAEVSPRVREIASAWAARD